VQLRIEPSSGVPVTRQIVEQIRTQCASGTVRPGEQLPSVRELARELAVNQNTVLRAYEKLTGDGFLERRHGAGTFVCEDLPTGQLRVQRRALRDELARLVRRARLLGVENAELHEMLDKAMAAPEELSEKPL
jgi:DNA-binding transcriptional regulator YhcF (GntR family)